MKNHICKDKWENKALSEKTLMALKALTPLKLSIKKHLISLLSMGLTTTLLTGCLDKLINDIPEDSPPAPVTPIETSYLYPLPGYLAINIQNINTDSSRSPDLVDGEEKEYAFAPRDPDGEYHHFMMVYGSDGNLKGIFPIDIPNAGNNSINDKEPNITLIVSSIFSTSLTSVQDISSTEKLIEYLNNTRAYFFINVNEEDILSPESYSISEQELKNITIPRYAITLKNEEERNIDYFIMSNSVFVKDDELKCASEINISNDKIFTSEDEARKAVKTTPSKAITTAYIERLAAKAQLNINKDGKNEIIKKGTELPTNGKKVSVFKNLDKQDNYSYQTEEKNFTVTVLGYGLNGLEKTEYLLKNIKSETSYYESWTQPDLYRSFWAEDPNYIIAHNLDKYPQQYRKALENSSVRFHTGGDIFDQEGSISKFNPNTTDYLTYLSFNQILGNDGTLYGLENTYDDSDESSYLGGRGYYSASTHLLAICQLKIDIQSYPNESLTLYRDQNEIFYTSKETLLDTKLAIMQDKMLPGGNSGIRILNADWANHKNISADLIVIKWEPDDKLMIKKEGAKSPKVIENSDLTLIPAELTGGDGQLLIAPADKNAEYYIGSNKINYNQVVSLFHKLLGPIDHYYNGYMYYATPLPHTKSKEEDIEWNKVGDVGFVRNNWYNLTITGVSAPGIPVSYADQPIIPMMDVKRSYLNITAEILGWHGEKESDIPFTPSSPSVN